MKILYICHRFPYPPKRGGKIRPFNMISHFANKHEVHVASLAHSDLDLEEAAGIAPFCASYVVIKPGTIDRWMRMLSKVPSNAPSGPQYFHSKKMQTVIDKLLITHSFDLIFVHCAFVAHYVMHVPDIPKILDFGDMDSQKWLEYSKWKSFPLSAMFYIEGRKMERYEAQLASQFDVCTATTKLEYDTLVSMKTANSADWFPNGVDSDLFCMDDSSKDYDRDQIVFVGRMDYFPNQNAVKYFAEQVMPEIRKVRPTTKFTIVGAEPSTSIKQLTKLPNIAVTGTVPDVKSYLRKAALTVAPLNIARGTQNKILESMSLGVPVVATSFAARGVDAQPGVHLLTADGTANTAQSVLEILENEGLRDKLSVAGRQRVLLAHSWSESMKSLDGIVSRASTEKCR